jgi:hypothetical protein
MKFWRRGDLRRMQGTLDSPTIGARSDLPPEAASLTLLKGGACFHLGFALM